MGFGSYDESEQENQDFDTDFEDDDGVDTGEIDHSGSVDFEIGASNDELLDRLQEMKEPAEAEE
ncbi:MAG: DUF5786 family protein [Halohasta sp.]